MDVDDMDYELPQDEELTAFAASAPANFAAGRPPGPGVPDSSLYKRWVCVYPIYLDSNKSLQKGRKVSKERSVKAPNVYEIYFAVQTLGLQTVLEVDKKHPRDFTNPGRVRIRLFDDEKKPVSGVVKSRKQLFKKLPAAIQAVRDNKSLMSKIPPFIGPCSTVAEIAAVTGQQSMIPAFLGTSQEKGKMSAAESAASSKEAPPPKKKGKKGRR